MSDYLFDHAVERRFEEARRLATLDFQTKVIFDKLYRLRRVLAEKAKVPAYRVMPNQVLVELAVRRPQSFGELVLIRGLGVARLGLCGDSVLSAMRAIAADDVRQHPN